MKFWRIKLLTALSFFGFLAIFFYSSCEKNVCDNVTCFNGGSCSAGTCRCPTGWEGPECSIKSVDRFVGHYAGLTQCNNGNATLGPGVIDSVLIYADVKNVNFVYIGLKSILPKYLHGYVSSNASTYSIIVPSDSASNYQRIYTVTLQNNKILTIDTYENNETNPGAPVINDCTFISSKKY